MFGVDVIRSSSGLKINLEKSELIPLRNIENVEFLAEELECKVGNLPSTYLGLPLGARYNFQRVLGMGLRSNSGKGWHCGKRQHISKGGKTTLIKSALSSLSIYYMSILHILRVVRLRLEHIQRNFLWEVEIWIKSLTYLSGQRCN